MHSSGGRSFPTKFFISMLSLYIRLPVLRRTDQRANEGLRWEVIVGNGVCEREIELTNGGKRSVFGAVRSHPSVHLDWSDAALASVSLGLEWLCLSLLLIYQKDFLYIITVQRYHLKKKHTHRPWSSPSTLRASMEGWGFQGESAVTCLVFEVL